MHFEKLRLSGFKSFVDNTEMLVRPGVTGVVGPNGCGKSNLLEALRWVMGETSAKSMRGSGMEDVIFAGAATRPPRNFAEVTLTIDNTERRAPDAFNQADRIEITRRIAKDSGSTYRYNGKEIRARDAQTLFADAATGANSPALVRQGQISEIINAKPKARKRILEDAAGIAGLHARRHEALMRLSSAETNMERLTEILAQLEAREATLAREAERAGKYRALSKDIRKLDSILFFRRWREADREARAAQAAIDEGSSRAARAAQAASEAARRRIELEEQAPSRREEEAIARALHQKLLIERETLATKTREAADAAERLKRQIAQHKSDLEREAAAERDAAAAAERIETELAAAPDAADHAGREELDALKAEEAAKTGATREVEAALERLTSDAARRTAEKSALERRVVEETARAQRLTDEAAEAEARIASFETSIAEAEALAEESRETLEMARMALEESDAAAEAAEEGRAATEGESQERRAAAAEASGAAAALRAELTALAGLVADQNGDGGGALDHVIAEPGSEAALGAALGDALSAPLSDAAAERGWRDLGAVGGLAMPAEARPLAELVRGPSALSRAIAAVAIAPRELGPSLQRALAPGQSLVSLEGDLWRWDGYAAPAGSAPSAAAAELERRNRLAALETACAEAEERAAALAAEAERAESALSAARSQEAAAREGRRSAENARAEAERQATSADAAVMSEQAKRASAQALAATRFEERETAADALEEARAALLAAVDPAAAAEAIDHARDAVAEAREAAADARAAREAFERDAASRKQRRDALAAEARDWRRRLEAAAAQRAALEERAAEAEAELESAEGAPLEIDARREALEAEIETAAARLTTAVDGLAAADAALKQSAQEERAAEAELATAREDRARLEARIEAAAERATEFAGQLEEAAGCEPQIFLERFQLDPETLPTVKELERDLGELRRRRDKLGPVNLRADQELAELTSEKTALAREISDLEGAVSKLRAGVNAINKEGRERLLAAFDEVNKNFSALFTHLFNGGDAKLVLVESEDPLEAGLEIWCQPPEKRLTSLSLLSGGEQTLTAISLIFAVFLVNPAPICVLDEVDAPLDDANVGRFCDLLDEMKRRTGTRFLIITHHAVTMSRMDRLFGVTMVEKGVSQLVSVDLMSARELVDGDQAA